MTTVETQEKPGEGQAPAEDPAGNGSGGSPFVTIPRPKQQEKPKDGEAPKDPADPKEKKPEAQPTEKDYRHAVERMHDEISNSIRLAELLIDRDPDAIYAIADENPSLAKGLLKRRPEYGASTIEELKAKKAAPKQGDDEIRSLVSNTESELKKIQDVMREERIQRMKEKHPDLKDDLEAEFRKLYSDKRFEDFDANRLLGVARALLGQDASSATPADVTMELLRQNEGAHAHIRPSGKSSGEDPSRARNRAAWGFTKEDEAKYLPPNIDDILAS